MKDTFERITLWVKSDEGPYENDPNDPGGPTNFGITLSDYHAYVDHRGTVEDLRAMDFEIAMHLYRTQYWDANDCDLLPAGIDYFVFDSGLLSGTRTAAKWLQRACGATPDGCIGPKTLVAIKAKDPIAILNAIESLRRASLRSKSGWQRYGRGWTNRVNRAKKRALILIKEATKDVNALAL